MANLLEIKAESAVFSEIDGIDAVPVWARGQVGAMYSAGIFSYDEGLDVNEELSREDAAEYLYRMIK